MQNGKDDNHAFDQAVKFVHQSARHIFLTGRAGTGKTTFLRHICKTAYKKIAVVAPTGVAAINAGGVTIHSFFQLAPGIFLPDAHHGWSESTTRILTRDLIIRNSRFSPDKKELLRELDAIIIDEVSMVKADTLDAIDMILRWVRNDWATPFGGVQMIYIGDLYQLPPVVKEEEWQLLKNHYKSPFFFDALVMRESPPLYLELTTIYRQNNPSFIRLLNAVRNNVAGESEIEMLNRRFNPDFYPDESDAYITLTTHNYRADIIHQQALNKLSGSVTQFEADINGDFPEKSYPVDTTLVLKPGAQIMFIKNDRGELRRYFNGKIGRISRISSDKKVYVVFPDNNKELELEKETWLNIRYRLDKEKNALAEEELGKFEQYPIRLAWAITIHKSQGLTFEKAIIDAAGSFSPGQVYVALSRMTSLEGMILKSKIPAAAISTDQRVVDFSTRSGINQNLDEVLKSEQKNFILNSIIKSFSIEKIHALIQNIQSELKSELMAEDSPELMQINLLEQKAGKQKAISISFQKQLEQLLSAAEKSGYDQVLNRVIAAEEWFRKIFTDMEAELNSLIPPTRTKKKISANIRYLQNLRLSIRHKIKHLQQVIRIAEGLVKNINQEELLRLSERCGIPEVSEAETQIDKQPAKKQPKKKAGESAELSLKMLRGGNSIKEIAGLRGVTVDTITKHLLDYLSVGEVPLDIFVNESKTFVIRKALEESAGAELKIVKESLGDEYSYNEIRAVRISLRSSKALTPE